jgi:hypothetical protein
VGAISTPGRNRASPRAAGTEVFAARQRTRSPEGSGQRPAEKATAPPPRKSRA